MRRASECWCPMVRFKNELEETGSFNRMPDEPIGYKGIDVIEWQSCIGSRCAMWECGKTNKRGWFVPVSGNDDTATVGVCGLTSGRGQPMEDDR